MYMSLKASSGFLELHALPFLSSTWGILWELFRIQDSWWYSKEAEDLLLQEQARGAGEDGKQEG